DDVFGVYAAALAQAQRAVHVRLRDRAAGIGLESELLELPHAAEAREELVEAPGLDVAGERAIEAVLALEDGLPPGEPGLREQRGHDAGVGRPARVQALGPRAVGEILDDPRGLAPADPERAHELVLREPVELGGRRGGREHAGERRGMVVPRVKLAGDGEADTAHHLDG